MPNRPKMSSTYRSIREHYRAAPNGSTHVCVMHASAQNDGCLRFREFGVTESSPSRYGIPACSFLTMSAACWFSSATLGHRQPSIAWSPRLLKTHRARSGMIKHVGGRCSMSQHSTRR
jgi:hypothetical protein